MQEAEEAEEAVREGRGGGGPCRTWRRTRGTLGAGEEETETGGAPCCGPVVFCSTMPNSVYMLLGNVTPVYIPIAVWCVRATPAYPRFQRARSDVARRAVAHVSVYTT